MFASGWLRSYFRRQAHWFVQAFAILALQPGGFAAAEQQPSGVQAAAAVEEALVRAIARAEKSVVAIACVRRTDRDAVSRVELRPNPFGGITSPVPPAQPGQSDFYPNQYGTGIVVDKRGLILTHYELLDEDCDYYVTTADHRVYQAKFKAADPRSELAIVEIEASNLTPAKLGDGAALRKGQIVIALGNPYAIARDGQVSASWGIVANLSRRAGSQRDESSGQLYRTTLGQLGSLIQTDAKLNLGTSGGALVNLNGELVGVTTSLAATAGYEQAAGYAIPVDETFRRVLTALIHGREVEYGLLGIQPMDLDLQEMTAGKHGTRVFDVKEGTPAQRFGVLARDVITHVDGKPIYDKDGLMLQVGRLSPETTVRLSIEREGRVLTKNIELAKYRVPGKRVVTAEPRSWRGLQLDYWTAAVDVQQGRHDEIDLDGCVVVTRVSEDSPAWKIGLRDSAVITHVGATRVSTPTEFFSAVEGKHGAVQLRQSVAGAQPGTRSSKSLSMPDETRDEE